MSTGNPVSTQLNTGTITGRLVASDVSSDSKLRTLQGSITFKPTVSRIGAQYDKVLILPKPVTVYLDANGAFSVKLVATDDDELSVLNWTYLVSFSLDDDVNVRPFNIALPSGTNADLGSLMPIEGSNGIYVSRGAPGAVTDIVVGTTTMLENGQNGYFTLTGSGTTKTLNLFMPKGPKGDNPTQATVDAAVAKAITDNQLAGKPFIADNYVAKTAINAASGVAGLDANSRILPAQSPSRLDIPVQTNGSTTPSALIRAGNSADPLVVQDYTGAEIGRLSRAGLLTVVSEQVGTATFPVRNGSASLNPKIDMYAGTTDNTSSAISLKNGSTSLFRVLSTGLVSSAEAAPATDAHIVLNGTSIRFHQGKLQAYNTGLGKWVSVAQSLSATFTRNSVQNIPRITETAAVWTNKLNDPLNLFQWNQSGSNPLSASQIQLPLSGMYNLSWKFTMKRHQNYDGYTVIATGGTNNPLTFDRMAQVYDSDLTINVNYTLYYNANDIITPRIYQNSNFNAAQDVQYSATDQPFFTVAYLGGLGTV